MGNRAPEGSAMAVAEYFNLESEVISVEPHGCGHINGTFLAETKKRPRYILQYINTDVFRRPYELMENVKNVTEYLQKSIKSLGGDPLRETLTLIPAKDGNCYIDDPEYGFWRCYIFVEDTVTYQIPSAEHFYESARAFGRFQRLLDGYPAETLNETIYHFHHTPTRFKNLLEAAEKDPLGRYSSVKEEFNFALSREKDTNVLTDALESGAIPLRVTHNDTKLNNVLIDIATQKALCVVDLDTVMPGSALYDFGDSIRFGAVTAAEDEPDTSKMKFSPELYEAYIKGYLEEAVLSPEEIEMMPWGAKLMTLECGMRFLTDYLLGDTYFKITRPSQNLDRCRTQFALVAGMESAWDEMKNIISRYKR